MGWSVIAVQLQQVDHNPCIHTYICTGDTTATTADVCFIAADRYVAHLTGLLPDDPWTAALADQAYFFCEDVYQTV